MLGLDTYIDSYVVAYCAHEYYHGDQSTESPLTDESYDALVDIIVMNWEDVPEELKVIFGDPESMNATTHGIHLDADMYIKCREITEKALNE